MQWLQAKLRLVLRLKKGRLISGAVAEEVEISRFATVAIKEQNLGLYLIKPRNHVLSISADASKPRFILAVMSRTGT